MFDETIAIARNPLIEQIKKWRVLNAPVRILFVVDTEIEVEAGGFRFGVERVIRLLRESTVGCINFEVDVALRDNGAFSEVAAPAGTLPRYVGFRFDSALPDGSKVIDHYDEVWCFGFKPDNFNGSDANINQPAALPATDAELGVLTTWMNNGGGIFATGDHDYLGASMCHRIPRIGTMRAWTNGQGVPPQFSAARIDTNRPFNTAEIAGTEVIEFDRQSDSKPQPIEWVTWMKYGHPAFPRSRRPHPVLCHPELGPIDVMPDHPHEGVVFDHVAQPAVGLAPITVTGTHNFPGASGADYPTVSGVQPVPMVIAYGHTLSDPPLWHEKGETLAKRFAMISVYDGHRANVGRAATDSTWHHWMNLNITDIEAAGGADWEKIKRYYLNLGVWLAPARVARGCFGFHVLASFYSYPGIEEFNVRAPLLETGAALRHKLAAIYGPCWVTSFVLDHVGQLDPKLRERIFDRFIVEPKLPPPPRPNPCLTCPPLQLVEDAVLGGVIRGIAELLYGEGGTVEDSLKRLPRLERQTFEKQLLKGAAIGLKDLRAQYERSIKETQNLLAFPE
jgi:hypothetical protein